MSKAHHVYSVKELLTLKDDPNRWIVRNMVPKSGRTLVFGQGGTFKSTVIFDLCVAVASGGKLIRSLPVEQFGPVLLNSTEGSVFDNKDRILAHVRAHDVYDPVAMPFHFCQQPFALDDPVDVAELEYLIKELKPLLIVLDPLDSFFSGDENSAKETKLVRRTIDYLIDTYKTAFVVIHHAAKEKTGDKGVSKASPRGSSAWYGWADSVIQVSTSKIKVDLPEPIEVAKFESLKQRNGKKGHVFSVVPHIDETLQQVTFSYYNGKDTNGIAMEYWKAKCYRVLRSATEPLTNTMIAEVLGVRSEKITNALTELELLGLAAKDVAIDRSFGPQSSRQRKVPAWRALTPRPTVDVQGLMVRIEEEILAEQLQEYSIQPEVPGVNYANPSGVCPS